ncbi:MAG TPA: DUF4288 domain-containing protein [Chitinophagaceae bacterium]|nr:DUF4288 domain-containing protein [Chitinophagaceae bacterium]
MNWYLAKMVFQIVCGEGTHTPQFDEQLRLVSAGSRKEAFHRAKEMGQQEEETFYNRKEQLVQWQFINVSELYLLNELIDGAELYSRIEERENADAYIYTVNQKAGNIAGNETNQLLQLT